VAPDAVETAAAAPSTPVPDIVTSSEPDADADADADELAAADAADAAAAAAAALVKAGRWVSSPHKCLSTTMMRRLWPTLP